MGDSAAYEVVVLGGGPAGCAAALALGQRGVGPVLLVEPRCYEEARVGESIPPDARLLLERLGVWDDFLGGGHEPCLGSCSSWGDDELGYNDFLFNPHGNGWHLDRGRFDALLARKAVECGATLAAGVTFAGAEPRGTEGFELRLTSPEGGERTVGARFVIDATGSHGRFARLMGARQLFHDRLLYAAAFMSVPPDSALPRLTMLEAVEYGWWYAARLSGGRAAVGVASDPEVVKREGLHTREGWSDCLRRTSHLSRALAGCDFAEDEMLVRTAPSFLLDRACGGNWLAAGDAASAYDPISSQGIYKALLDGLKAAQVAAAALAGDDDDEPRAAYQAHIVARFDDYLRNRNYFYNLERRWPSSPFWLRRRERVAAEGSGSFAMLSAD